MPIVVDYTPVAAMGSLAFQTGQAQGKASGQASFIDRQFAVDQQTAEINQRNRELGYQQTWAPINARQQEASQARLMDREYGHRQGLEQTQAAGQLAELAGRQDQAFALEQMRGERQRENIQARSQADVQQSQMQDQANRAAYIQRAAEFGQSEEQAAMAYDQFLQERATKSGRFAPGAGNAQQGGLKRPPGQWRNVGFDAMLTGNFQGLVDALGSIPNYGINIPGQVTPQQAMLEAQGGVYQAALNESVPLDLVQRVASDPSVPEPIRSAAAQALLQRGDVKFGSNQAQPQGQGAGGYSDEDLYRALQGLTP